MTTVERVRRLCDEAESRIDFEKALQELTEALALVGKDASLLDLVKRQFEVRITAARDLVEERSHSPSHLSAALAAVASEVDRLPDPEATLLKDWFLRVLRQGDSLSGSAMATGAKLTARLQSNPDKNRRDLQLELDRLEWLAEHGPDPALTSHNAEAVRLQAGFLPMAGGASAAFQERVARVREVATTFAARPPAESALRSAAYCRKRVEQVEANQASGGTKLSQTETWCVRVSCFTLERMIREGVDFGDESDGIAEAVTLIRALLDTVGYRSSTTVFAAFTREIEELKQTAENSTDFSPLFGRAVALQGRIKDAKSGKDGETLLKNPHWQTAMSMCQAVFELLSARQQNGELLRRAFDGTDDVIGHLEHLGEEASIAQVESAAWKVGSKGQLARWVERLENEGLKRRFSGKLEDLRERQRRLAAIVANAEPKHIARLAESCRELQAAVAASNNLPEVYTEIRQLSRLMGGLSHQGQGAMRPHMRGLFEVFDRQVAKVDLLDEKIRLLRATIQKAHKRISAAVDFDDLYRGVRECREWTRLKAFPEERRAAVGREIKTTTIELHKLKARKTRWETERKQRADDVLQELAADLAEVTSQARANPGGTATWEGLVDLSDRLRAARHLITDTQFDSIAVPLDAAFAVVKQSRFAFGLESERVFAEYNETLSDVLHALESAPGRETAMEAIGTIKPIRQALRTETRLLRRHRQEVYSVLDLVSRSIDEILESANANSARERAIVAGTIDRLENAIERASDWREIFGLISEHKSVSASLRAAQLSIGDRRELRGRMEQVWDAIQEKLEQTRYSRTIREDTETKLKRLEQQGWLFLVREPPRAA